ncbi:MAG: 2-oxoacid:ferredoxin oxidoreductase subunit beta [Dehalococcoidia bacterium]
MVAKTEKKVTDVPVLTKKDFTSDTDPRWCPGCGDYSILAQMQKMLPSLGVPLERIVFISGIGCSSRFPYYMNTYGFHSIHGRAPTLATGLKLTRPELLIFVITGDGDGLSIGGNHLLHVLRRNVDINIILFNNQIYGLTKGQYSPTSEMGKTTKSSPMGSIETPLNPISVALSAEATFVARSLDTDTAHLTATLERAARHKGVSFVEVYQNCNIFNDGAFRAFTDKPVRKQRMLYLEQGQPMLFGDEKEHGIALQGSAPTIVDAEDDAEQILVHDEHREEPTIAHLLARMAYPEMPVPVGVFRQITRPSYGELLEQQIRDAREKRGEGDLAALVKGSSTWLVE